MTIFKGYNGLRERIEQGLAAVFDEGNAPRELTEGMRYAALAPGKRLRPCIVLAVASAYGACEAQAMRLALALELLHTASLIHDDLPALDNDVLRRGQATNHVRYGEANAILHGDAMINLAHSILLEGEMTPEYARACRHLSRMAGADGMLGGQYLDVNDSEDLERVHRLKTAALFDAAFSAGALLGGADDEEVGQLSALGVLYGRLFQAVDDLLDVGAGRIEIGKSVGKDEANGKRTLCTLYGRDEARRIVTACYDKIVSVTDIRIAGLVRELADFTVGVLKK